MSVSSSSSANMPVIPAKYVELIDNFNVFYNNLSDADKKEMLIVDDPLTIRGLLIYERYIPAFEKLTFAEIFTLISHTRDNEPLKYTIAYYIHKMLDNHTMEELATIFNVRNDLNVEDMKEIEQLIYFMNT